MVFMMLISACLYSQDGLQLFDDTYLHEIRFTQVDTNIYIDTKNYQLVNMEVDNEFVDSVGIKRKGNISGYHATNKYGIKIKTNKYISGKKYDGIKEWTLHMNYQDPSMLREKLTYDLCAELGLYSLRTAFAMVYINDVYRGLFTIVEGKDEMYKHIFNHRDMDAVESLDFGDMCYLSTNPEDYFNDDFPAYVVENGNEVSAKSRFVEMLDLANNTSDDEYISVVSNHFNIRDFMRYQALNVYLLNFDSYIGFRGNQIYVYDTVQTQWQVTPWDFNASFGLWNTNNFTPEDYPFLPFTISNGCIAGRLTSIPEMKDYYLEGMCKLHSILSDTSTYFNEIDRLASQIREAVYEDNRKVSSNQDFEDALGYGFYELFFENQPALKTFVSIRSAIVEAGLIEENYSCELASANEKYYSNMKTVLSPNPTSGFVQLTNNSLNFETYKVIDTHGNTVLFGRIQDEALNIENLASGIYIIQLIRGNDIESHKVLKISN